MTRVQILEQNGRPAFAVIPFDIWLKVRESAEDIEDVELYDTAKKNDDGFRIPSDVVKRELAGENLVRIWREHRGLTVEALATAAGISKSYLSQIENSKRHGATKVIKAISTALGVPLDILIPDVDKARLAA